MKKSILFVLAIFLLSTFVLAEQGGSNPGVGQDLESKNVSIVAIKAETKTQTQELTQEKSQVQSGNYVTESGKKVQVQTQNNNMIQLKSGESIAQTNMKMTQEQTQDGVKLQVSLSNGKNAEVKVMPDVASEKALEQLRLKVCSEENGCQIELKEVGKGDDAQVAYEVQAQKQAKVLGLFKAKMQVQTQVSAENGEIIKTKKSWWSFLASESEE